MKKTDSPREDKFKYFGSIGRIAVIFFIGFSIFLVVSTMILIVLTKPEREVSVPDVEGKRFIEAYSILIRKGIKPDIRFKDIADIDDGVVLSQYPEKGKLVPENHKIHLLISRSEYQIEMPNLTGKELPLALNNLKNIHRHGKTLSLSTGVISYVPSDTVTDNIVMDQNPRPGDRIRPDRKINLLVSAGKVAQDAVMPDVTGQSIELCFNLLRAKGLVVNEEVVAVSEASESGTVLSQTPAKGAAVNKGDACTLRVGWFKLEKRPYSSYEKVEYQVPADEKAGLYEAYVQDGRSKRIRFSKNIGPGQKIEFVFRREGEAHIIFHRNKKRIGSINIDVD
jgi:beta-lactam-binding protein with PASTA domain